MIYRAQHGRVIYGEDIGILLLDEYTPHVPGDIANATTFDYPVRFEVVDGLTVPRAVGKDASAYSDLRAAAERLVKQGVRAVTSNCGFLALHQRRLAEDLPVPVFLSSLMQIPFITSMLGSSRKVGVVTADAKNLDGEFLQSIGVGESSRLTIRGLEEKKNFSEMVLQENGILDPEAIEGEVLEAAGQLVREEPAVGALLMECALLPAYSAAVQAATGLPVFDFVTMIDFVYSATVQCTYDGHM